MDITGKVLPPCADIGTNQGWDLRQVSTSNLVIHSDTTDGSTTFADAVGTHTPAVGAADVEHDTAQKKWGKTSILFDGDSGYLTVPDHADWAVSNGNFTIDFWVRFAALPTDGNVMNFYNQRDDLLVQGTHLTISNAGGTYSLTFSADAVDVAKEWSGVAIDTWYHIAVIRGWGGNANDFAICVDGTQIGTTTTNAVTATDVALALEIGISQSNDAFLNGWIDEFRWDKGTARWTKNFIPPYGAYC